MIEVELKIWFEFEATIEKRQLNRMPILTLYIYEQ